MFHCLRLGAANRSRIVRGGLHFSVNRSSVSDVPPAAHNNFMLSLCHHQQMNLHSRATKYRKFGKQAEIIEACGRRNSGRPMPGTSETADTLTKREHKPIKEDGALVHVCKAGDTSPTRRCYGLAGFG